MPIPCPRWLPLWCLSLALLVPAARAQIAPPPAAPAAIVAPEAKVVELAKGFKFTEGPTVDAQGNVYFSDVAASRTYRWSVAGGAVVVREQTAGANGLAIARDGQLLACEGGTGRVVALDAQGKVTVVAGTYEGQRFNQPNDLWIDPRGGVYFTDPLYGRGERPQGGEHVYYVPPDRRKVIRVIADFVRPNGLVGTPDGKTLYVADHGAGKTWRYTINADGTLSDKALFAPVGSDGMKLDRAGNVYLTTDAVVVYSPAGVLLARIAVPQPPTNLCFAGARSTLLVITAGTAVYGIETTIGGLGSPATAPSLSPPPAAAPDTLKK